MCIGGVMAVLALEKHCVCLLGKCVYMLGCFTILWRQFRTSLEPTSAAASKQLLPPPPPPPSEYTRNVKNLVESMSV